MAWRQKQADVMLWLGSGACAVTTASCQPALTAARAPADLPVLVSQHEAVVGSDARAEAEPLLANLRAVVELSPYRTRVVASPGGKALLYASIDDPEQQYLIADWKSPHPVALDRAFGASF